MSHTYNYGPCPVCERQIRVLRDGTIGRHGDKTSWPPQDCAGYGRKPKAAAEKLAGG